MYAGLLVASRDGDASTISVFDGAAELEKTSARKIQMDGEVKSLLLANSGGAAKDLFGLAAGNLFTVERIANSNASVRRIALPFKAVDVAVGNFIADREARAEIAILSPDGRISYLTRFLLDTRPFTTEEVRETCRKYNRRGNPPSAAAAKSDRLGDWAVAESHRAGGRFRGSFAKSLSHRKRDRRFAGDRRGKNRVRVLFKEPIVGKDRAAFTGETKSQDVSLSASPAAVLPMRLNVMGQQGLVVFAHDSLDPIAVVAAPNATFVVTKTADTNDGVCNADCSLREAVVAANGAAGADMITFGLNGTFQLTIAGANENAAATGDLDVTQALTIVGNGTSNTIIQAGSNATNGIDKVFSVNPLFNSAFASSFSGMTMRYGRNPSTFNGDGYGGGLDWDGVANGTISLSNVDVEATRPPTDAAAVGFTTASGGVTMTNVNVTNNTASRTISTNGTAGGGIAVGFATPFAHTNGSLSNNNRTTGTNNNGGGLFIFAVTGGSSGNSNLAGLTISEIPRRRTGRRRLHRARPDFLRHDGHQQ